MRGYREGYIKAFRSGGVILGSLLNPPNYSDLTYDFASRSSLALVDKIAADNAEIVGAEVGVFDGVTSKITFDPILSNDLIQWTVAFRGSNYSGSTSAFIIGGLTSRSIMMNYGDRKFITFREDGGAYNEWNGGGNTSVASTPTINDSYDIIWFSDGTNIYLIYDGIYKGYITPVNTKLYFNKFVKGYSNDSLGTGGNYSDFRFWTSNVGQTEALKYHLDTMTVAANVRMALNGHNYDSISGGLLGTLTDVTFALDTEASPLPALTNGYVDKGALQIINPSLNTTNVAVYDKMHLGGSMHNLISSFVRMPTTLKAVGSELVTNGDFDTNIDNWSNTYGLSSAWSNGVVQADNSGGNSSSGVYQDIGIISGRRYVVTVTMKLISGDSNGKIRVISNKTGFTQVTVVEGSDLIAGGNSVTNTLYFTGLASSPSIQFACGTTNAVFQVDNISVYEVASIFDRSNTTIQSAASRASLYYDSGDPTLYHVSELEYDTLVNYFEAAYINRVFTGIKASYTVQDFIFRILAYATQKTGADLTSVKNYIKYS